MENAYELLYGITLVILGILMLLCLWRAIRGPRTADRLLAANMTGTLTVIIICVLGFVLHQGYLTDIALLYVMLSFLAVVLLTKIRMGIRKDQEQQSGEKEDSHD